MEIICPECQFSRQVDESKIPARSQVATCPKCQTRFQFRELPETEEEDFSLQEAEPAPAPTSDLHPEPGAEPDTEEMTKAATETVPEPEQQAAPEENSGASVPPWKRESSTPPVIGSQYKPAENEHPKPEDSLPGEEPRESLWDKIGGMTPPESAEEERPGEHAVPEDEQKPIPGWTGEFNDDFPDPMDEESDREEHDSPGMMVPPPFEQLDRYGFFHGLYMTIKLILLSPRLFFSVMPVGGGLAKPLTFTILISMIQGFIQYFWGMTGLSVAMAPGETSSMAGVSGAMAPLLMLLFMPAAIAVGQFLITGMYHILLILMRADNQGFEGTFRALTYANAPIILGIFPMPFPEIEFGWMVIAAIWGLFLTITGLKYIHKTSYAKVVPVALIPLLLAMIAALALTQGGMATI